MKKSKANGNKDYKLEAEVAGVGVGTLLIYIANNLPDDNVYKQWLVLISPTVSISISVFWKWFKSTLEKYHIEKELKSSIHQARQTLNEALDNPKTSDEHRRKIQIAFEELEMLVVDIQINKVKTIAHVKDSEYCN